MLGEATARENGSGCSNLPITLVEICENAKGQRPEQPTDASFTRLVNIVVGIPSQLCFSYECVL